MMFSEEYSVLISRGKAETQLRIKALDAGHAQAQSLDICRSLGADKFELIYGKKNESKLSKLYEKLAFNKFDYKKCDIWDGSFTNNVPSIYAVSKRFYIRPLILGYLDIQKDKIVKNSCNNIKCINPYHNHYLNSNNSKIGGGDLQIVLAFRSQGVSVTQIAEVLKVHRSTIYRALKNERLLIGDKDHRQGDP